MNNLLKVIFFETTFGIYKLFGIAIQNWIQSMIKIDDLRLPKYPYIFIFGFFF